jgi:hypothetical protein
MTMRGRFLIGPMPRKTGPSATAYEENCSRAALHDHALKSGNKYPQKYHQKSCGFLRAASETCSEVVLD